MNVIHYEQKAMVQQYLYEQLKHCGDNSKFWMGNFVFWLIMDLWEETNSIQNSHRFIHISQIIPGFD